MSSSSSNREVPWQLLACFHHCLRAHIRSVIEDDETWARHDRTTADVDLRNDDFDVLWET